MPLQVVVVGKQTLPNQPKNRQFIVWEKKHWNIHFYVVLLNIHFKIMMGGVELIWQGCGGTANKKKG